MNVQIDFTLKLATIGDYASEETVEVKFRATATYCPAVKPMYYKGEGVVGEPGQDAMLEDFEILVQNNDGYFPMSESQQDIIDKSALERALLKQGDAICKEEL
jgi:hypothetical protein